MTTNTAIPFLASGAVLIGEDTTDSQARPIDIFSNPTNYITALSSILAKAIKKTDFAPYRFHHRQQQQESVSLISAYNAFIQEGISFYGFRETNFKATDALPLTGDLLQFEEAIRTFLADGGEDGNRAWADAPLIARSLRDLVPGYLSVLPSTNDGRVQWILSLIILRKEQCSNKVHVQHAQVTMDIAGNNETQHGSTSIPKQEAKFEIGELEMVDTVLIQDAQKLGEEISIVKVHDVIELLSTPKF